MFSCSVNLQNLEQNDQGSNCDTDEIYGFRLLFALTSIMQLWSGKWRCHIPSHTEKSGGLEAFNSTALKQRGVQSTCM